MKDLEHLPTFALKEWLTLDRAAKHLEFVMGEEVTVADILRLALDKHIKLSVRFFCLAKVKRGEIIRYPRSELDSSIAAGMLPAD